MSQSITDQKSRGKRAAAFLADYYRSRGVRAAVGELSGTPLFLVAIGGAWALGWDWRLLILLPLSLLCGICISGLRSFHQTGRVYKQLSDLYANHPHWQFTPTTTADYLEALYHNSPPAAGAGDGAGEREFAKSILPPAEYHIGEHLRLVAIETAEETGVGVLATFATIDRAWVFLDGDPRAMRGFEHFKVLHEVGHTHLDGMLLSYATKGSLTQVSLTLVVVALMLRWEPASLALLAAYLLVFLSLTKFTMKWVNRHSRYIEELHADDFALERCPRLWFEDFSEQDVKDFAAAVCGNAPTDGGRGHTSPLFDAPLTDKQVEWRRTVLVNKLNRLLKGDEYKGGERVPVLSARLINLLLLCQQLSLIALSLALGLWHAELTTTRFVALLVVMTLITFAGFIVGQVGVVLATRWDANLNAKPVSERSAEEQKRLDSLDQGVRWRQKLETWRGEREDRDIDDDVPAAGTTGRLFLPDELNIQVNTRTFEAYLYHSKDIDYRISHFEYAPESHSVIVVMDDRTRLDLGIKLRWDLRPYFLKADEIRIVRTENRQPVDGIVVPLRKLS